MSVSKHTSGPCWVESIRKIDELKGRYWITAKGGNRIAVVRRIDDAHVLGAALGKLEALQLIRVIASREPGCAPIIALADDAIANAKVDPVEAPMRS